MTEGQFNADDDVAAGTDELVKAIVDSMGEEANTLRPGEETTALLCQAGFNQLTAIEGLTETQLDEIMWFAMRGVVILGSVAGVAAQAISKLEELGVQIAFPQRLEPPDSIPQP